MGQTNNNQTTNDELAEELDIEQQASTGKEKPKAKKYKFRVDTEHFLTTKDTLTGREVLEIANKLPPENYQLQQRSHGHQIDPIELDQTISLLAPGVERFMTIPRENTDG